MNTLTIRRRKGKLDKRRVCGCARLRERKKEEEERGRGGMEDMKRHGRQGRKERNDEEKANEIRRSDSMQTKTLTNGTWHTEGNTEAPPGLRKKGGGGGN